MPAHPSSIAALLETESAQLRIPDFDLIARPYRFVEYLTFGRALERCRLHFLEQMTNRTHALILGDGDGRFLASFLARYPVVTADAIDTSAAMLELLRQRCNRTAPSAARRLKTHYTDALGYLAVPSPAIYDLIVTHFFLDCLTQAEVDALAIAISGRLAPGTMWLISDFLIPEGLLRLPAKLLVRVLYLCFRILSGLRTTRLPDHASALASAGFIRLAQRHSCWGILTAEIWVFHGPQ